MNRYPLRLQSVLKTAIWGGTRLIDEWGKSFDGALAESWELTVREKEMSKITNGIAKGMPLSEYIRTCGATSVSPSYSDGDRFPLLVKFIDAAASLSVQVHPDDEYAKSVENDSGKTEMWYIVDASEGAEIIFGLADGVEKDEFSKAVDAGEFDSVMQRVKVNDPLQCQ